MDGLSSNITISLYLTRNPNALVVNGAHQRRVDVEPVDSEWSSRGRRDKETEKNGEGRQRNQPPVELTQGSKAQHFQKGE